MLPKIEATVEPEPHAPDEGAIIESIGEAAVAARWYQSAQVTFEGTTYDVTFCVDEDGLEEHTVDADVKGDARECNRVISALIDALLKVRWLRGMPDTSPEATDELEVSP
jgi:hypothetical protein